MLSRGGLPDHEGQQEANSDDEKATDLDPFLDGFLLFQEAFIELLGLEQRFRCLGDGLSRNSRRSRCLLNET